MLDTDTRPQIDGYVLLGVAPALGRTATVYKAVRISDGRTVAIKIMATSVQQGDFLEEAFRRETDALTELKHPNIVEMLASGITQDGTRYIILDWMESDLPARKNGAGPFEWHAFWRNVGRPLSLGVAHAHSRDIAHRDLAPRNILIDDQHQIRVADFGIAKLRRFMRSEQTLREFVSPPFTPPEIDDGSGLLARDVFALVSLFCWYAAPTELLTYEAVGNFAATADCFSPELRAVFAAALSEEPDDRPATAEDLIERIDRLDRKSVAATPGLSCQLALAHYQADKISRSFELFDRGSTEQAILDDLNAICGIKQKLAPDGVESADPMSEFVLLGLTRSYHVKVDERAQDRLIIYGVKALPPGLLEKQRDSAVIPRIEFRFHAQSPAADKRAISDIQMLVSDHIQTLAEEDLTEESRLFDAWSRILQARQDVEASRERPVRYHHFRLDGARITFTASTTLPQDIVQESRQVRLSDGSFMQGYIESVDDNRANFRVKSGDPQLLYASGDITVNVYAASEALRRQQKALDDFRQRSVVRPHMAEVLLDPTLAAPIDGVEPEDYFQSSLDKDKKEAVAAALGSEDIMLLRGPPGTGKTTFIAELILQTVRANPDARILLASQTNVAIDNAIERVIELRPQATRQFEVVRLGTNDERISNSVENLRLSRRLEAWTKEVTSKVEEFAEERAETLGIERRAVLIGMLLEKLLAHETDLLRLNSAIKEEETALGKLRKKGGEAEPADPRSDLDVAGSVNARRLHIAQMTDERRKTVQLQNQVRAELAQHGEPKLAALNQADLRVAVEQYLDGSRAIAELRPLLELGAEWTARFGRQDHFEAPFLSMADVVAGTCLGVAGPRSAGEMQFDLCIIDEASKATATEILVPLSRAKRWILVGDSKQLPPFQDDALRDSELLERYDLRADEVAESLFSYLERRLPASNVLSLRTQRRMIQPINDLIASCFYPGQGLECARAGPDHRFGPALPHAVTWLDTSMKPNRGQKPGNAGVGCFNRLECQLINTRLNRINKQFARRDRDRKRPRIRIAVITGYADQRALLERTLNPRSPKWSHIEILLNTVDAFQGRQADMVIYSVTRSNPKAELGFLKESPRLNVALSRGRDALLIVGDKEFCRGIHDRNPFRDVINWIEKAEGCATEMAE